MHPLHLIAQTTYTELLEHALEWSRSPELESRSIGSLVYGDGHQGTFYWDAHNLLGVAKIVDYYGIFYILSVMSRSCRLSHLHASSLVWHTGIDLGDNSSETTRDYGVSV